jgi:PIN domain
VIILDTNVLERLDLPDGPLIAMLRTLATQTGHSLGLTDIVLEEHLAHFRRDVQAADARRVAANRDLRRLIPSLKADGPPLYSMRAALPFQDQAVEDRTLRLQQTFQILRTPEWAARDALLREARRELPAGTALEAPGSGGRDAAIWLTAVDACKDGQDVYFVSTDKAAFGEGVLKAELASEIKDRLPGQPGAFHYCFGVDALLGELATVHAGTLNLDDVGASAPVRDAMRDTLEEALLIGQLAITAEITSAGRYLHDHDSLRAIGFSGRNMAYDIGGQVWACSRIRWQAKMHASVMIGPGHLLRPLTLTYELHTTLVMRLARDGDIEAAQVTARSVPLGVEVVVNPTG